MKFAIPFVVAFLLFSTVAMAHHIEYCHAEVVDVILQQDNNYRYSVCGSGDIKVKGVFNLNGMVQVPAKASLYYEGNLIETRTIDSYGTSVVEFSSSIPVVIRRDPQVTVSISSGCDPTPDSKSVNFTTADCPSGYRIDTVSKNYGQTCTPVYGNSYRCSGDWIQRQRLGEDCRYGWIDWKQCDNGCVQGYCLPPEEKFTCDNDTTQTVSEETGLNLQQTFGIPILAILVLVVVVLSASYYRYYLAYRAHCKPESF